MANLGRFCATWFPLVCFRAISSLYLVKRIGVTSKVVESKKVARVPTLKQPSSKDHWSPGHNIQDLEDDKNKDQHSEDLLVDHTRRNEQLFQSSNETHNKRPLLAVLKESQNPKPENLVPYMRDPELGIQKGGIHNPSVLVRWKRNSQNCTHDLFRLQKTASTALYNAVQENDFLHQHVCWRTPTNLTNWLKVNWHACPPKRPRRDRSILITIREPVDWVRSYIVFDGWQKNQTKPVRLTAQSMNRTRKGEEWYKERNGTSISKFKVHCQDNLSALVKWKKKRPGDVWLCHCGRSDHDHVHAHDPLRDSSISTKRSSITARSGINGIAKLKNPQQSLGEQLHKHFPDVPASALLVENVNARSTVRKIILPKNVNSLRELISEEAFVIWRESGCLDVCSTG